MALPILGPILDKIVDRGGEIVSKLVKDRDLSEKLVHEFKTLVQDNEHEFQILEMELEAEMYEAQQKTIQAELHQSDLYTKRTRPKIARQSWYVTAAYALSGMLIPALPAEWGLQVPSIQWEIFLVLASPALTYMGVRGFEKWKHGDRLEISNGTR